MSEEMFNHTGTSFGEGECECMFCDFARERVRYYNKYIKYPTWICNSCADKQDAKCRVDIPTMHEKKCDLCEELKFVTHIRNYSYPEIKNREICK